jgi:hypothetical protein
MKRIQGNTKRGATLVVCGQVSFLLFIALCVTLHPGFVLKRDEGGMSNYGVHALTALPYTLALLSLTWSSWWAAAQFRQDDPSARRLRHVLNFYGSIIFVILLSTYVYTRNQALRDVHFSLGTVLIVFEIVSSLWMFGLFRRFVWDGIFLLVQLAGSALCLATIDGELHLLFLAEMVTAVGFAGLVIHTSRCLGADAATAPRQSVTGVRDSIA